ncbi:MAG: aldehyde dehydrogenase [Flavobacteriales bacterium]|jgi:aldehyde dehydrogenase (NAD+)|nr:aldehyde dehydrogenase [Flavobacteriales bacterium]MBT5749817.1 aldehyde dehydrogenase [Flavobacteriales bacterium]
MDIAKIVTHQKKFFKSNATKEVNLRIGTLKRLKLILKENEDKLYTAIYTDFKKSKFETYLTELSLIYNELNDAIKNLKKWSKQKRVRTNLANFPAKSYIIPDSLGTILIISAWNYPYQLSLIPAISAIAAGNTVVIKPSEIPNNTSKILVELINANFDEKHLTVIEGGVETTTELLQQKWDKIFFTGSTNVGRIVYKAAAKNLTPVTLELGGKSPTFVLADCNIKITAKRIIWAKFLNAGQTCIAPDYLLVEDKIKDQLLLTLKKEIENAYPNNKEVQKNYVQIVNDQNFNRLKKLIPTEKVYHGGATNKENRSIAPTLLHNINFEDSIMEDEIFGPILPVIAFENLEDVIIKIKEREKPLSLYVYSKNKKIIKKILHEISFGGGAINESIVQISNPNLPFGGVGASGIGSYNSKAGFDTFTHYKSILHKTSWLEPNLKYTPFTELKMKILKFILE